MQQASSRANSSLDSSRTDEPHDRCASVNTCADLLRPSQWSVRIDARARRAGDRVAAVSRSVGRRHSSTASCRRRGRRRTTSRGASRCKGRGWSSPVAWNDTGLRHLGDQPGRVQGAVDRHLRQRLRRGTGRSRACPKTKSNKRVIARDIELTSESGEIRYMVYAFDANDRQAAVGARSAQGRAVRRTASQEHVRVGNAGHRRRAALRATSATSGSSAYSLDGKLLWTTRFDPQPMYLDFGTAASPVVHDGRVFVVHDNEGKSFVAAVDAKTGKQLWTDRARPAGGRRARAGHRPSSGTEAQTGAHARLIVDRPRSTPSATTRRRARSCGGCAG